ncbi:hypothetical protein HDU86_001716 [Geranomyces michiganensis]|nr:hypothetical protein HDU86_001716 [Geranomyces michiganensis]
MEVGTQGSPVKDLETGSSATSSKPETSLNDSPRPRSVALSPNRASTKPLIPRRSTGSLSSLRLAANSRVRRMPKLDLKQILDGKTKKPATLDEFRTFMVKVEYGSESLDFYLAVQSLRDDYEKAVKEPVRDAQKWRSLQDRQMALLHDYIAVSSPHELNISSKMRTEISQAIESSQNELNPSLFLNVQRCCYELMAANSLPRFQRHVMVNIGEREMQSRQRMLVFFTLATLAVTLVSWFHPNFKRPYRWFVVLPAFGFWVQVFQVHLQFCVVWGFLGKIRDVKSALASVINGKRKPATEDVEEACVLHTHRELAIMVLCFAAFCGGIVGVIVYLVPLNV